MITAKHHPFFVWFFEHYSKIMIRRNFSRVRIHGEFHDRGLPLLLIGNHFSWWDGFIANLLNIRVFHRRLHIMMLEEQLKKRMFLNKAGAYSIQPGSRSVLDSLNYTAALLKEPGNLVTLYPQGEFQSLTTNKVHFEKGTDRILKRLDGPVGLIFYAALIDYFEHKKPLINIYFQELDYGQEGFQLDLEEAYNQFLAGCIKRQVPDK